jgi:hypothetical protein
MIQMLMKGYNIAVLAALAALVLAGCAPTQPSPKAAGQSLPAQTVRCPRVVVVGFDRTGSYALAAEGRRQVADVLVRSACPGDTWYFRWISNDSFSDRNIIFTLRLPPVPPASSNPFDRRSRAAAERSLARIAQAKRAAAVQLAKLRPASVYHTDIWGFLAKAATLLASAPQGSQRILILATDLGDTLNRRVALDLAGVRAYVVAFQSGQDAAGAAARRGFWEQVLSRAGVDRVAFIDPSQTLWDVWAEESAGEAR